MQAPASLFGTPLLAGVVCSRVASGQRWRKLPSKAFKSCSFRGRGEGRQDVAQGTVF